jgi:hypothetical protein
MLDTVLQKKLLNSGWVIADLCKRAMPKVVNDGYEGPTKSLVLRNFNKLLDQIDRLQEQNLLSKLNIAAVDFLILNKN